MPVPQLETERSFCLKTDLTPTTRGDDVTSNVSTPEASNDTTGCLQMRGASVYLEHVGAAVIGINTMRMKTPHPPKALPQ